MDSRSETKLSGVRAELADVVRDAWALMPVDGVTFRVTEGLRTIERQRELVASGASRTMDSKHLTGHAVDLAAFVGPEPRWELNLYYRLALVMRNAAVARGIGVVWGGCWRNLADLGGSEDAIAAAVGAYGERSRLAGRRPFVDGPHFELAAT